MATIDKKLIHFNRKADFETRLAAGDIRDYSIVCIKDAKLIWTHGQYYGDLSECLKVTQQTLTDAEKAQVLENLGIEIPTKVSDLENDSSFVSAVDTGEEVDGVEADYVTETAMNAALSFKQNTITDLSTIRSGASKGATAVQPAELASVAKSGSYNDLTNKPTIPSAVTESTVSGWGFTKNTGTYSKPSAGIPKSDLASAVQTSLGKADTALQEVPGGYAKMEDIPTKVSQLENDVPYVTDDVVPNGVYAVDASGKLIDYNTADSSCSGVALVAGEHKFMIAKSDATNDGSNYKLYWKESWDDLSLTNYNNADGTNDYGCLPKPDGSYQSTPNLSGDFTTWTAGALSDFNGKANTDVITVASSHAEDMCTVLNTFNASDSFKDWYVPACGQLALMYLNMTEINAALDKIGGTALAAEAYWSSSENSYNLGWGMYFGDGSVLPCIKDEYCRVRFVRDILTSKPLKERVSELESSKQDKVQVVDHGTADTAFVLTPNVLHRWGTVSSLSISLAVPADTTVANYYMFEFTSGATATTLSLPESVTWVSGVNIEAGKTYQASILNGCGVIGGF